MTMASTAQEGEAGKGRLNDFNVDEFIACARYGELDDLKQMVTDYLQAQNGTLETNNATLRAIYTSKNSSGNTALHMAAANGELEILKYILPHLTMGDVNSTNSDGSTPLHWAALNGKLDCVQLLLDSGADATLQNEQGRSAVTVAEQQGHMDVVNVLLKSYEPEEEGDEEETSDAANGRDDTAPVDDTAQVCR